MENTQNKNIGQIFKPTAAHLRTKGIEIRPEGLSQVLRAHHWPQGRASDLGPSYAEEGPSEACVLKEPTPDLLGRRLSAEGAKLESNNQ